MKKIFDKLLQIFAAGTNVAYTGMDANGNYDPSKAGVINANTGTADADFAGQLSPEMKTFYEKTLIRLAGPKLVHDQFGQKKPIPKGNGRSIEFRQFATLPKALQKITEGVTPVGSKLGVGVKTATVEQYGDYLETTDMLQLTAYDDIIGEYTKALADQAGRTLDTITRNILNAGTNRYLCPKVADGEETAVTSRANLDMTAKLRVKDVFKIATILKNQNAPKIGGSYVAIIHPSVAYDLMQEAGEAWVDITKYTEPTNIMNGEIGKLGGVRFVESTEAKIVKDETCPEDLAVYCTLFLGANAYGVTDIEGGGLQHVFKGLGQNGNDPLNQRSSIGWKATKTAEILVEAYIVRAESCCSFSDIATEN